MAQLGATTTWCARASSTHTSAAAVAGAKAAQHVDANGTHQARWSERPLLLLLLLLLHLLLLLGESKKTSGRAQERG